MSPSKKWKIPDRAGPYGLFYPPEDEIEWISVEESPILRSSTQTKPAKPTNLPIEWIRWLSEQTENGASDIYLEKSGNNITLKTRTATGTIESHPNIDPKSIYSKLKVLSGLNQGEDKPIDEGTFQIETDKHPYRFRVSFIKSRQRESCVLRPVALEQANRFQIKFPSAIQDNLYPKHGLALVSGTTGSGKSTTLHHILKPRIDEKIITIEDPIEFILSQASQSNIDPVNNWTFDNALKTYLRADPDVIMVGELRDKTTIDLACRAALTGHAVYGTIHAASAKSAYQRLLYFGQTKNRLKEILAWIIHQRLIPKPCPHCHENNAHCLTCANTRFIGRELKMDTLIPNS